MSKLLTPAGITAALTIISMVAALFGKAQLAAFFNDTETVQTILGIAALFGIGAQALMPSVTEEKK